MEAPVERPRITPAMLAKMTEHRAPAAVPPKRLVVSGSVPVYFSRTGQAHRAEPVADEDEHVVRSVVDSLLTSVSPDPRTRRELVAAKPMIPAELDRTLLLDLSARLHIDELDVPLRFRLRLLEAF